MLLWTLALIPAGVVAGVHVQMMERSVRGKDGKGAGGVMTIRSNRWAGAGAAAAAVGLATVMGVLAVSGS